MIGGQSVIATTDLVHVPGATDASVTRLRVSPGAILREAPPSEAPPSAAGQERGKANVPLIGARGGIPRVGV